MLREKLSDGIHAHLRRLKAAVQLPPVVAVHHHDARLCWEIVGMSCGRIVTPLKTLKHTREALQPPPLLPVHRHDARLQPETKQKQAEMRKTSLFCVRSMLQTLTHRP